MNARLSSLLVAGGVVLAGIHTGSLLASPASEIAVAKATLAAATLESAGAGAKVSLRIPGQDPVACVARVVDVKVLPGNARAAFAFVGLPPAEVERLETFVFDSVLEQLP